MNRNAKEKELPQKQLQQKPKLICGFHLRIYNINKMENITSLTMGQMLGFLVALTILL